MSRVEKVWRLLPSDPEASNRLAAAARVSPVVAQLLLNRGVTRAADAARFLDPSLAGLHPHALPNVPDATERLAKAVTEKRRICVYGDYDVDGVTGTAILFQLLTKLGAAVEFYVPLRLSEGYGLNAERLRELAKSGVSVVVSVDCGIASLEEAAEAKRLGLELIITDHHEMKTDAAGKPILPDAAAIVHPRLPGGSYPFDGLSGAGVALKLAWALAQRASGGGRASPELRELLLDAVGLAALGLVADVVPLRDENRILVRAGLDRIRDNPSLGLKALIDATAIGAGKSISSEDVGFILGPRINAAGRLGCASMAVELLTTKNGARAKELAEWLELQNSKRQTLERKFTDEAKEMVDAGPVPAGIVVAADWHPGVIGIVASRIAEQYARPTLVIARNPDERRAVGSGRSVPGFALHEALQACDDLLDGHGGHAAAAGFKVMPDRIDALKERFDQYVRAHYSAAGPPAPRLTLDAEVPLSAVTFGLLKDIDKLEPYGAGNPKPKFLAAGLKVEAARLMGKGDPQKHMDFRVRQGETVLRAVAWNMADRLEELLAAGECCLAFTPKVNEWNGYKKLELQVIDVKPGATVPLG